MSKKQPLYVTRPSLPPLAELIPLLEEIWANRWLTNEGPFHERFEAALATHLDVPRVSLVTNATLGLMLALKHVGVEGGEVITTPFSFVATGHSILWSGAKPVFADIDPITLNLDPLQIERHITPNTRAILAVHCYGQPCNVELIDAIAKKHGLKVVYDAAHAFGVRHKGRSVLNWGDLSVLSFHATKVFNTFEGGAVISPTVEGKQAIDLLRNYGIVDEVTVTTTGLNAKMSEFDSAFGLLQLRYIEDNIEKRRGVDTRYREWLAEVPGIRCLPLIEPTERNFYSFPILVEPDYPISRDALYHGLRERQVYARRYFHPLMSDMPMYRDLPSSARENLPVATQASSRVLCLPMFADLAEDQQRHIVKTIREVAFEPAPL